MDDDDNNNNNNTASNIWLKTYELFPDTTGLMRTIQDRITSTHIYEKKIFGGSEYYNTRRKCWTKSKTIQHVTGECCALTQGDYTNCHSQVANIVYQEVAT